MPAAMGTGHRINKRTSHLYILLAEKVIPLKKSKVEKTAKKITPKVKKVK